MSQDDNVHQMYKSPEEFLEETARSITKMKEEDKDVSDVMVIVLVDEQILVRSYTALGTLGTVGLLEYAKKNIMSATSEDVPL